MASKKEQASVSPEKPVHEHEKWALPPIDRKQYTQMVRNGDTSFNIGRIVSNALEGNLSGGDFPQEEFDEIYIWWNEFEETKALLTRFITIIKSDSLPAREKRTAAKSFAPIKESFETVIGHLQKISEQNSLQNSEAVEVKAAIDAFEEEKEGIEQIIALCEAIEQSGLTDPLKIRQLVAQHALEELSQAFQYERLYYAADVDESAVVADDVDTERRELLAAFLGGLWKQKKRKEMEKFYKDWRAGIRENYDDEINTYLSRLWKVAIGENLEKRNAVSILEAQAFVFDGLQSEGALEWDPDEEEWEEEEDEENWDEEDETDGGEEE